MGLSKNSKHLLIDCYHQHNQQQQTTRTTLLANLKLLNINNTGSLIELQQAKNHF